MRRQTLLETEAIRTELEGDPPEHLVGFQQQSVDSLAEHRSGTAGPCLSLSDTVTGDAQLVAVQLDHGQHAEGDHPLTVVFVQQVFLAVALRQRRGKLGRKVRRGDLGRQRE